MKEIQRAAAKLILDNLTAMIASEEAEKSAFAVEYFFAIFVQEPISEEIKKNYIDTLTMKCLALYRDRESFSNLLNDKVFSFFCLDFFLRNEEEIKKEYPDFAAYVYTPIVGKDREGVALHLMLAALPQLFRQLFKDTGIKKITKSNKTEIEKYLKNI